MHEPLEPWLDAVYAAFADAPAEVLNRINADMVKKSAMIDPEAARDTWGVRPEHKAMAGMFGRGRGLEAGNDGAAAPPIRKSAAHDPTAYGRTPSGAPRRR